MKNILDQLYFCGEEKNNAEGKGRKYMETIFLGEGKEKEKDEKYHGQGKIVADKWTDRPRGLCQRSSWT